MKKSLAVVTGGSSGIGHSICSRLAEENYMVLNADIKPPQNQHSNNCRFVECNVTLAEDIEKLSKKVQQTGEPKVLVLNAGQGVHEKLREGDPEKWFDVINLNLCGTLRVLRAILPFMSNGHVIFISSVSASKPHPYGAVYAATKNALDTVAETLRLEELPEIKVTTISPGVVDTAFFENMLSGEHTAENIGWGAVEPGEIAGAVAYALQQKEGTVINNIVIRPSAQEL
ncbi:MAG: SDR family oxidoreductase [Prolixibacteraceae bacterium]